MYRNAVIQLHVRLVLDLQNCIWGAHYITFTRRNYICIIYLEFTGLPYKAEGILIVKRSCDYNLKASKYQNLLIWHAIVQIFNLFEYCCGPHDNTLKDTILPNPLIIDILIYFLISAGDPWSKYQFQSLDF